MQKKFVVKNNSNLSFWLLAIMSFFVIGLIIRSVSTKDFSIPLVVSMLVFVDIPCVIAIMWLKVFRVTVSGMGITYRNIFGISRTVDVSEISRVKWRVNNTRYGKMEKITVYFRYHKFSVETLMQNFNKFSDYIENNVDGSRIRIVKKSFK